MQCLLSQKNLIGIAIPEQIAEFCTQYWKFGMIWFADDSGLT